MKTTYHAKKITGALDDNDHVIVRVTHLSDGDVSLGVLTVDTARYVQKELEEKAARHERLSHEEISASIKAAQRGLAVEALEDARNILLAIGAAAAL